MPEPIHLVLAVDRRCVLGCAVSMQSVMDNAAPDAKLHFHLIINGIKGRDRDRLEQVVRRANGAARIRFYSFDPEPVRMLLRSKLITHTAYSKLYLGELLPATVERCIWLDCDLAFERDIIELWNTDLRGKAAGAVDNGTYEDSRRHQDRLGLREPVYFNSGVLLIDMRRWRDLQVGTRALGVARHMGDRLWLHDQDALNAALEDEWIRLDDHWNVWVVHHELRDDSRAAFHYMGSPKPWHADYDGPFRDRFLRYLERTPFKGARLWSPAGLGAGAARIYRKVPFLPSIFRVIRARVRSRPS